MKLSEAKEWLPIIQAAAEGKTIQVFNGASWIDHDELNTSWRLNVVRIKPEPKLVKGAAYVVCDNDGSGIKYISVYLGDGGDGCHRFGEPFDHYEDGCRWDNYELFVQPEALRGEDL